MADYRNLHYNGTDQCGNAFNQRLDLNLGFGKEIDVTPLFSHVLVGEPVLLLSTSDH